LTLPYRGGLILTLSGGKTMKNVVLLLFPVLKGIIEEGEI